MSKPNIKRTLGPIIFLAIFLGIFCSIGSVMGAANMLSTMMNTAYALLMETVFYIMAIAVLAGAVSALLSEFGVVDLINKLVSPLMKPLFGLPGAASLGIITTYLSDRPAILALANDGKFRSYFKKYQLPALSNLFGMGLIVTTFMIGIPSPTGENLVVAALIGNLGAVIGSIVSTRLMLSHTKKVFGTDAPCDPLVGSGVDNVDENAPKKGVGMRVIDCLMSGGKTGVQLGFDIIPGVLIICTMVMMLTNGAPEGGYAGGAYEGVAFLPWVGEKISFLLKPLFGFTSAECIAVPVTALGAAGAAIGLIPGMISAGTANAHDIAVFTAMCMCWSGYLSIHVAMMDSLKHSELTGRAILSHTIGGLCAGVAANWIYQLVSLL